MATLNGNARTQASLGSSEIRQSGSINNIGVLTLGRVTSINYQDNSIAYVPINTNAATAGSTHGFGYQAMLPMNFAGRNGYGNSYGTVFPVREDDIVLIGFIDGKATQPIVIGRYADGTLSKELTAQPVDHYEAADTNTYAKANQRMVVYPDQTFDLHDGRGNQVLTYSGKSFILVNADVPAQSHATDDGQMPQQYENLDGARDGSGQLREPMSDTAPEIIMGHQGIVDAAGNVDNHAMYVYVGQDGTYRTSIMQNDEDWRTYFEQTPDGEIKLRRQEDSKIFDQGTLSSEIGIDHEGNVTLRSQSNGLVLKPDGIYNIDGTKFSTDAGMDSTVGKNLADLQKTVYENNQATSTQFENISGQLLSTITQDNLMGSINAQVSAYQKQLDDLKAEMTSDSATIATMAADGDITPNEKVELNKIWADIKTEYPAILTQAQKYGVDTTNLSSAYTNLAAFVEPLLADMLDESLIDGQKFTSLFDGFANRDVEVEEAIYDAVTKALSLNSDEIARLSTTVTQNSKQINENATSLSHQADSISDLQANLQIAADKIALSATKTSVLKAITDTISSATSGHANLWPRVQDKLDNMLEGKSGKLFSSVGAAVSASIPVTPNSHYTITAYNMTSITNMAYAFFDSKDNFLAGEDKSGSSSLQFLGITAPDEASYMLVGISDKNVNVKVERGDRSTAYLESYQDALLAGDTSAVVAQTKLDNEDVSNHAAIANTDWQTTLPNLEALTADGVLSDDDINTLTSTLSDITKRKADDDYYAEIYNTDPTLYNNSYDTIVAYLQSLLAAGNTKVDPTAFNANMSAFYKTRNDLWLDIAGVSSDLTTKAIEELQQTLSDYKTQTQEQYTKLTETSEQIRLEAEQTDTYVRNMRIGGTNIVLNSNDVITMSGKSNSGTDNTTDDNAQDSGGVVINGNATVAPTSYTHRAYANSTDAERNMSNWTLNSYAGNASVLTYRNGVNTISFRGVSGTELFSMPINVTTGTAFTATFTITQPLIAGTGITIGVATSAGGTVASPLSVGNKAITDGVFTVSGTATVGTMWVVLNFGGVNDNIDYNFNIGVQTDFSTTDSSNRKMVGTYTDYSKDSSSNPNTYVWTMINAGTNTSTSEVATSGVTEQTGSLTDNHNFIYGSETDDTLPWTFVMGTISKWGITTGSPVAVGFDYSIVGERIGELHMGLNADPGANALVNIEDLSSISTSGRYTTVIKNPSAALTISLATRLKVTLAGVPSDTTITITNVKVEESNIATDWSLAPTSIATQEWAKAYTDLTAKGSITVAEDYTDANISDAKEAINTQINNASANAINTSKDYTNSTKADLETSTKDYTDTAVGNIKVGATNLINNGNFSNGTNYWREWGSSSGTPTRFIGAFTDSSAWPNNGTLGATITMPQGGEWGYAQDGIKVSPSTQYTLSAYFEAPKGTPVTLQEGNGVTDPWVPKNTTTTSDGPQRCSFTFTTSASATTISVYFGYNSGATDAEVKFTLCQLEQGTIATDWHMSDVDQADKAQQIVNNLQIGAGNLIVNSRFDQGSDNWTIFGSKVPLGIKTADPMAVTPNTITSSTQAGSFDVKVTNYVGAIQTGYDLSSGVNLLDLGGGEYTVTFNSLIDAGTIPITFTDSAGTTVTLNIYYGTQPAEDTSGTTVADGDASGTTTTTTTLGDGNISKVTVDSTIWPASTATALQIQRPTGVDQNYGVSQLVYVVPNTTYTYSAYWQGTGTLYMYAGNGSLITPVSKTFTHSVNKLDRVELTVEVPAGVTSMYVEIGIQDTTGTASVTVSLLKLESGSKATDWTSSVQDVNTQLNRSLATAYAAWQAVRPDNITAIVEGSTSYNSLQAAIDSKPDASIVDALQAQANSNSASIDDIVGTRIVQVQQSVDQWSVQAQQAYTMSTDNGKTVAAINNYMNFSTGGLTFGKADSPMKVNIDNERISFTDTGATVAYISGQRLYITDTVVKNSLVVGRHKIYKSNSAEPTSAYDTLVSYIGDIQ